jgi:hypothetical protein
LEEIVARTWLRIRVELLGRPGDELWPRPGRVFAAARSHTFGDLADAIDTGFARWDLGHLHEFRLADGTRLSSPAADEDQEDLGPALDDRRVKLSRLQPSEQFVYVFDLGDSWTHLCTVEPDKVDPLEELGDIPDMPVPTMGWGDIPDQYGRRWEDDDGEGPMPVDPGLPPLPDLRPIRRDDPVH